MIRGSIYGALCLAALGCTLAALGTPVAGWHTQSGVTKMITTVDVWYVCGSSTNIETNEESTAACARTTDRQVPCMQYKDRFFGMQAFYGLTGIGVVFALTFAGLDRGSADAEHDWWRVALAVSATLLFAFSIIGFSLALTIPHTRFCTNQPSATMEKMSAQPHFKWGPSPFLMVATTAVTIAMCVVALVVPPKMPQSNKIQLVRLQV
jgi:hypothetical protein